MSYISNLNLLNADLPVTIDEKALQEELALWANAKFNFDPTPDSTASSVLLEAGKENQQQQQQQQQQSSLHSNHANDNSLLETLTKLTEFVQAPNASLQQQQFIQPASSSSLPFFPQQDFLLHSSGNNVIYSAPLPSPVPVATTTVSPCSTPASQTQHQLPRIAPAPGPVSGIQMLEADNMLKASNSNRTSISASPSVSKKRMRDTNTQDDNEISADDDKRRRNTAASARFRLKKKLREQALEKQSKEMASHVEQLEAKVKELEMEAKWLRALVVEKDPSLLTNSSADNSITYTADNSITSEEN